MLHVHALHQSINQCLKCVALLHIEKLVYEHGDGSEHLKISKILQKLYLIVKAFRCL